MAKSSEVSTMSLASCMRGPESLPPPGGALPGRARSGLLGVIVLESFFGGRRGEETFKWKNRPTSKLSSNAPAWVKANSFKGKI